MALSATSRNWHGVDSHNVTNPRDASSSAWFLSPCFRLCMFVPHWMPLPIYQYATATSRCIDIYLLCIS
jgi:hypothetical protein